MTVDQVGASYRVMVEDVRAALYYAVEAVSDERALAAHTPL